MAIITLLSDFGERGHYVAAVKARLLKDSPTATLVDITHQIRNSDIAEASFVLKAVYGEFPKGTVHLVCIGAASLPSRRLLAASKDDYYFVVPDNGVLSLLSPDHVEAVLLSNSLEGGTFPEKYIMAPAAAELANGMSLAALGDHAGVLEKRIFSPVRVYRDSIGGEVMHIDAYGNLITNIDWATFQKVARGRTYMVKCGYERFHHIQQQYSDRDFGDCIILFNSQGLLEVAINQGSAADLLGLAQGSPVMVFFGEEEA